MMYDVIQKNKIGIQSTTLIITLFIYLSSGADTWLRLLIFANILE